MPKPLPDLKARMLTIDTGKRSIDLPVDGAGHLRRAVRLGEHAITRGATAEDAIGFKGHAAVFDKRTWIGSKQWGFAEEIAPGAFTKTINDGDVRFLQNHDANLVLARNTAGTLRLSEDSIGLAVDADMAPTTYARDLAILLERGDVTQMSFGFEMVEWQWRVLDDGTELLRHLEVKLWDVSSVTYPAYTETDGSLRMELAAAARSAGFDSLDLGRLLERLADPDPDVISVLRGLAGVRAVEDPETAARAAADAERLAAEDLARDRRLLELRMSELAERHQLEPISSAA